MNAEKIAQCEMVELHERKAYVRRVSANMLTLNALVAIASAHC